MKPVSHYPVANIRISEQTTKFYLSFFYAKNAIPGYRTRLVLYYEKSSQAKRHSRALDMTEWRVVEMTRRERLCFGTSKIIPNRHGIIMGLRQKGDQPRVVAEAMPDL